VVQIVTAIFYRVYQVVQIVTVIFYRANQMVQIFAAIFYRVNYKIRISNIFKQLLLKRVRSSTPRHVIKELRLT
jgi:rRNA-processing protein FCF1